MTQIKAIPGVSIDNQVHQPSRTESVGPSSAQGQSAFSEALRRAALRGGGAVHFSAHAQRRLAMRSIQFGESEIKRLEEAVDTAARKGGRDSLILMDELALIVNVKNRTVVTAIDKSSRRENVFTNIDTVVMT